jgi:hypothetical protein
MMKRAKEQLLSEMNESIEAEQSVDKVALEKEATQDRVNEWVEYKDLATENKEVEVAEIAIEGQGQTRGWFKRLKRKIKKAFRKVTFRDCRKKYETRRIKGVDTDKSRLEKTKNKIWYQDISIWNVEASYCTPAAFAMIINYHHHILKKKDHLYINNVINIADEKKRWGVNNKLTIELAKKFKTSKDSGTGYWKMYRRVPHETKKAIRKYGMRGHAFTWYSSPWNRALHHRYISHYIRRNNPVVYSAPKGSRVPGYKGKLPSGHSMPVIGYKVQKYSGSCWKKALPDRRWLLVDTEYNRRAYIRFDSRSNYGRRFGKVTYVKVY